jgi:NAD(P)-dependent dehydrogenase (short-subunit alcohol dehydrogenase family)
MELAGKVAIVTGAGSGIGAALARRLAREGARVVVSDISPESTAAVAAEIAAAHPVAALAVDAADEAGIAELVELAQSEFGPVDVYFANAGIMGAPGLEAGEDAWDLALDINVLAHVRAAQQLVPGWVERGGGYFVSTASAAGLLSQLGSAVYSVTKHAAVGFAEWLSITYGDCGVRVSCVCPMGVDTPLLRSVQSVDDESARLAGNAVVTSGAVLSPEQVAESVLDGVRAERFLILPHPEVLDMFRRKAEDYDRWVRGMRRYQRTLQSGG